MPFSILRGHSRQLLKPTEVGLDCWAGTDFVAYGINSARLLSFGIELSLEAALRYFHLGRALLAEVQSNSDFLSASGTTNATQEGAKEDDDEAGPSEQPNDGE